MVAEVLSAAARAVREYPTEAQDAVRLRLPPDRAGPMDQGLSRSGLQARRPRVDPERECGRRAGARLSLTRSLASAFLPPGYLEPASLSLSPWLDFLFTVGRV